MKKYITPLILFIIYFAFTPVCKSQGQLVIDKVIAKVGGEYILYSTLIANYRYQKERNPDLEQAAICRILEDMVAEKILVNQAKLDSVEVLNEELEAQLDHRINTILRMLNGDEQRFQDHYGKSVLAVKDDMREDLRQQILAEKIQRNLINEVTITPKEVIEFFESIPKDSLPYLNSEVELGEIIYHPKVSEEEREKARQKLEEIRRQIVEEGADFAEMVRKHSMDGSTSIGGDLGWQKRGTFVTEFEAEAYSLEIDEISPVIQTEFGFHVIQLLGRRGNTIHTRHILIKPEITQADLDKALEELDSIKTLIELDSMSFERAVKLHSDENSLSYNNNGRMVNPNNWANYFETSELPFDIYFAIENLKAGEISEPIPFENSQGGTSYKLLKLFAKTRPHIANLEQDYTKIAEFAKESKKMQYYNEWMMKKMEATFIEVEPDFAGCPNLRRWMSITQQP